MMKKENTPHTDDPEMHPALAKLPLFVELARMPSWEELYERMRILAMRRSTEMILDDFSTDEQFDRGARCLRTLMGAAEIARRIRSQDEKDKKEQEQDDQERVPTINDEDLAILYRQVVDKLRAVERADASLGGNPRDGGDNHQGEDGPKPRADLDGGGQ